MCVAGEPVLYKSRTSKVGFLPGSEGLEAGCTPVIQVDLNGTVPRVCIQVVALRTSIRHDCTDTRQGMHTLGLQGGRKVKDVSGLRTLVLASLTYRPSSPMPARAAAGVPTKYVSSRYANTLASPKVGRHDLLDLLQGRCDRDGVQRGAEQASLVKPYELGHPAYLPRVGV